MSLLAKKGIESFPFFLFLTILIAAVVLTISFYQIQAFSEFSSKKELSEGYNDMLQAMQNLRATSDYGSFTRIVMKVPSGYSLQIFTNDTVIIEGPGQTIVNELEFDIVHTTIDKLEPGTYEIEVFYGNLTGTPEPYTIYFV
jgi:hypothetical protein